jgi:hypothetical protein
LKRARENSNRRGKQNVVGRFHPNLRGLVLSRSSNLTRIAFEFTLNELETFGNFLKEFKVTIDYPNETLRLEQSSIEPPVKTGNAAVPSA